MEIAEAIVGLLRVCLKDLTQYLNLFQKSHQNL